MATTLGFNQYLHSGDRTSTRYATVDEVFPPEPKRVWHHKDRLSQYRSQAACCLCILAQPASRERVVTRDHQR
ncbi:MAG: hypothetical protein WBB18_18520 [Nodosilinea sp.]